jgi:DHA1 family quinolone resistance protein-like MFS transporter
MKNKNYFTLKEINPIIKFLTLSDIMIISGWGLVSPIFAVFITNNIKNGNLEVVGIASTIYLLSKSLGQIPIAKLMDKIKGEKDDFRFLLFGSLCWSIVPLFYMIISQAWQLYIIQFFYGLTSAFAYPAWYAIFTRHIDKNKEGIEWGIYNTLTDLGGAISASLGGLLAYQFGFKYLFIIVSIISLFGSLFLLFIRKNFERIK